MLANVVYRDEGEKPDGSRYEMVAWQVPATEDFPQGQVQLPVYGR